MTRPRQRSPCYPAGGKDVIVCRQRTKQRSERTMVNKTLTKVIEATNNIDRSSDKSIKGYEESLARFAAGIPGGKTTRRLKEAELHEISITPRPSDDRARVTSVKKGNVNDQIFRHADALLFRYGREERKRKATIEAVRRLLEEK